MRLFVTEFADSKREIERHLNDVTTPVIKHLFKLYCMPESNDRNHWISEIANFLNSVKRLSGKNKFPNRNLIMDWTYYKWEDLLTDPVYMKRMLADIEFVYGVKINKSVEDICETFNALCCEYFLWLANELSRYGSAVRSEIYNKLNELF